MLGRRASAKDGPKAPVESAFPVGGRITSNGDAARHISCVKRQPVLDGRMKCMHPAKAAVHCVAQTLAIALLT
jgi:hypothetical protein